MTSSPEARVGPAVHGFHSLAATPKDGGGWEGMNWPLLRFPQGTPLYNRSKTRLLSAATAPFGLSSHPRPPTKISGSRAEAPSALAEPANLYPGHRWQVGSQGPELLAEMVCHVHRYPQLSGRLDPPPTCKPVSLQQLNQCWKSRNL